jgi:KUP system potassium uptake protein
MLLYPMVALATAATVIASQAVISGAFSLTSQAMQLGYCPRIQIRFTSEREKGQIYIPNINWLLLFAVIALVLAFKSSSNLASAYGIAVTLTMMIDTCSPSSWCAPCGAGTGSGGAVPDPVLRCRFRVLLRQSGQGARRRLVPAVAGALHLYDFRRPGNVAAPCSTEKLNRTRCRWMPSSSLKYGGPHRVQGTGIFMTTRPDGVPRAMLHNLLHNKVLHERVILLNVNIQDIPHVAEDERIRVEPLDDGFYRIQLNYGFKDDPNIPVALEMCAYQGMAPVEMMETSFFLGRETIVPNRVPAMTLWRQVLFMWMFRNADTATDYFKLPTNRVVELGTQIEL